MEEPGHRHIQVDVRFEYVRVLTLRQETCGLGTSCSRHHVPCADSRFRHQGLMRFLRDGCHSLERRGERLGDLRVASVVGQLLLL